MATIGRATPSSQKPAHTSIQFSQLWLLLLESFASLSLKFTTQRSLFMEFSQLPFLLNPSQSSLSLEFIVVFLTGSSAATFLGLFLIHFQDWTVLCRGSVIFVLILEDGGFSISEQAGSVSHLWICTV